MTDLVATLEALSARCRRQSLSWAAAMGQEMHYRYQEQLMEELLDGLRSFRARVGERSGDAASGTTAVDEASSQREIETRTGADWYR